LQRLEKQRSLEINAVKSDLNTVDASTIIRRKVRRNRHSRRRHLIGIIVLVIGVGALFAMAKTMFWNSRHDKTGISERKTVATIAELTTESEVKKPVFVTDARPHQPTTPLSTTASPAQPVKKKEITGKKRSAALKPTASSRTLSKSDMTALTARKPEKSFPQKTKAMPQKVDTHKNIIVPKPAKTATPVAISPKSTIPKKDIKQPRHNNFKTGSSQPIPSEAPKELGLTLQAITWLNNPRKRFTVINNSIIRLGEMVDGFRLMRIEEEQVTVEKDNRKWLLKFNRMDYTNATP